MTTSDDSSGPTPIDDPEWIKGLVAKALLQAAETEAPAETDPPEAPATAPVASEPRPVDRTDVAFRDGDEGATGTARLEAGSGIGAPRPEVEAPAFPRIGMPLVIGRQVDDPPPVEPATTASATAVVESRPPAAEPAEAEHLPGSDDDHDHVMVEEDATVEGFRSSDIRTVLEWLAVIVSALVVALVIKAFVLQAFWIPSESMESTVNKGDRILVNKLSYRLHDVRRGDLVVFKKLPGTPGDTEDLIKRAIALPGETIEVREDGRIWIWGPGESPDDALLLQEPYLDPGNERLAAPSSTDSLSTDIWDEDCANQPRTPGRCTLGPDQFFMMGDNRNSSSDSRFFGPVPEDLIVGRAFLRIWPLGDLSSL